MLKYINLVIWGKKKNYSQSKCYTENVWLCEAICGYGMGLVVFYVHNHLTQEYLKVLFTDQSKCFVFFTSTKQFVKSKVNNCLFVIKFSRDDSRFM